MGKEDEGFPHQLGVEVIKSLDKKLIAFQSIQETYLVFLDEILDTCKKSFASSEAELIPKTPSAKRSRRKLVVTESEDDVENEEPPKKRQSIVRKGRGKKKGLKGSEQEDEADDESDTLETSSSRSTRRAKTASQTTAPTTSTRATRSTRNTRARNKKNDSTSKSPVMCLMLESGKKEPTPATPTLQLNNRDFRNKITKKKSGSGAGEAVQKLHTPKTPLASVNRPTVGSNGSGRVGFMSVKERASKYEEAVLSSGGTTPTPKQIGSGSRPSSRTSTLQTPSGGKNNTPATPSTLVKSSAAIALSSKTPSSPSTRSVSQIRKHSTQPPPTTPVSRNSSVSKPSNRTSMRRSLKLSASKKRRSSMMRHVPTVPLAIPEKEIVTGKTNEVVSDKPKLRAKLSLKKTKVLRPKVTRSKAKAADIEEKMETDDSLQSSSMSDMSKCSENLDKSAELRRQTVTLEKSSPENQPMVVDGTDSLETRNSLQASSESMTENPSTSSVQSTSTSDNILVNNQSLTANKSEEDKTASAKNSTKTVPRLSRTSSGRKHSRADSDTVEETAGLRPKRTTRGCKNKVSVSSVISTPDSSSKTGKQRRSARTSSRTSKSSNGRGSGAEVSDIPDDKESEVSEVFAVPEVPAPKSARLVRKRLLSDTNESSDCESRGQTEDEDNTSEMDANRETLEMSSDDNRNASESDSDVIERSLSPVCPSDKVVRPNPASFLSNLNNDKNKLFNLNTAGVKSFLRSSPAKKTLTMKEQEQLRRKDLLEKQMKEEERLQRRKRSLFRRAEEKRRQREEHSRKVTHLRMEKMKREQENKHKILEKLEHKNKIPEQVLEGKRKENQEKKQIREQKHTEAEERRLQEDTDRLKKLKEKEEEERQHAELLQRKRDFEEQERAKKIAEEKRKQEEFLREQERKKREEELKQIQIQQEAERLRLKQQAEKEREQQRFKAERIEKERKDAEARRQREREVEMEVAKLKELEQQRKIAEARRAEELREIQERYIHLMQQQKEMENCMTSTKPATKENPLNTTLTLSQPSATLAKSPQSYKMTPPKKYTKKVSEESYDISGLRSDESTDDEDTPKRSIPSWAQDRALRAALVNQYYYPVDTAELFGIITLPDLNEMFVKKKARFNKRTSSAIWDSPLLKGPFPST